MWASIRNILSSIYSYRGFILGSVKRDFQARYKRSSLGILWLFAQPIVMVAIYTTVFSQVMKSRIEGGPYSYSIYLIVGTIVWGLNAEILNRSQAMFVDNANLIKKISFPKLCLPLIVSTTAVLNFAVMFFVLVLFLTFVGAWPGTRILLVIPILILQVCFSMSLGMILGVFNVFFRDVGHMTSLGLQLWFWFTPVVYPISFIPEWARPYWNLNPMVHVLSVYHDIFVFDRVPRGSVLLGVFCGCFLLLGLSLRTLTVNSADLADEL